MAAAAVRGAARRGARGRAPAAAGAALDVRARQHSVAPTAPAVLRRSPAEDPARADRRAEPWCDRDDDRLHGRPADAGTGRPAGAALVAWAASLPRAGGMARQGCQA